MRENRTSGLMSGGVETGPSGDTAPPLDSTKDKRVKHETALDLIDIEWIAEHKQSSKSIAENYTLQELHLLEFFLIRSNFLKINLLRSGFDQVRKSIRFPD